MKTAPELDTAPSQTRYPNQVESLYKRWALLLIKYSDFYVNDKEASNSIVNDIFLQLWYNDHDIKDIKAYLFKAVKNASLNHLSSKNRKPVSYLEIQELTLLSDQSQSTGTIVEESDKLQYLHKMIGLLPEKRQLVFRMHRIEGFNYAEIADLLQISPRTVEDHLAKSMKFIHENTKHFFNQVLTQS